MLCDGWNFPTPDGKASFFSVSLPDRPASPGRYRVATRRGKQFNSMVQQATDPLTKAVRDSIFMSSVDAAEEGLGDGDRIALVSDHGRYEGSVRLSRIAPGNLQVHWPEAQGLIDRTRRSPEAGIPDYNAEVSVEKVTH
jgi:anaerobic selenocysteine-containing dehydrogenase